MENETQRSGERRSRNRSTSAEGRSRSRSRSTSAEGSSRSRSRSRSTTPATRNTVTHNELTDATNYDLLEFVETRDTDRAAELVPDEQLPTDFITDTVTMEQLPPTARDRVAELQLPTEEQLSVMGLSRISISEGHISDSNIISSSCPICHIDFQLEEGVSQMRCRHIYHTHCISRWLSSRDGCPVCRRRFHHRSRSPPRSSPERFRVFFLT